MKNYFFLILSIITVSISSCKKEAPDVDEAEGTINALSYNVAGLPDFLTDSSPEKYMILVSPLLNDFDIVHVQEDFCYHDSLLAFNNHNEVSNPLASCVPESDGLNTFTNYKIKEFERQAWNQCAGFDCATPKGFSYSKIELHKGVYIDFYNVHCNAGGGIDDLAARRNNLKQLIDYMEVKSAGEAVILMGDFNNRYTRIGDSIRIFQDLGFTDVWLYLIRNGDVPIQNDIRLEDCYPISTSIDCEAVDKVFYKSSDEMQIEAITYQLGDDIRYFYEGNDTLPLSDHEPLMVQFTYSFKRK